MNPKGVSRHLAERKAGCFTRPCGDRQAASAGPHGAPPSSGPRRLPALLATVALVAQLFASVVVAAPSSVVSLAGVTSREPGSGDLTVSATVSIAEGYHINAHDPGATYLVPTELALSGAGLTFNPPEYPAPLEREFAFAPGQPLRVYSGQLTIAAHATGSSDGNVHAKLRYQACDATHCLQPAFIETDFRVPAPPLAGAGEQSEGATGAAAGDRALAPDAGAAQGSDLAAWLEGASLPVALTAMLLLGLTLNLTPCVYPLISVTIGYFGSQSRHTRKPWPLALAYVAGITLTFAALGTSAAVFGGLFGRALQSPLVLVVLAAILAALAASSFGLFELRVPSGLLQRFGGSSAGPGGAFAMGLTMGIVAAPCIGPVVLGLLIYVGAHRDLTLGLLLFLCLGLGMGAPYLLLAAAAGSIARLPRAGEWLGWVERFFGVLLLGMALYFVTPLFAHTVSRVVLPVYVGTAALYLGFIDRSARALRAFTLGRRVMGALGIVAAVWLSWPSPVVGSGVQWEPLSARALDHAIAAKRPAIVEFGAQWCLPCREMERTTFVDPEVVHESTNFSMLQADVTETNDQTQALLDKFSVLGVPTMIFYDAHGSEVDRVVGFLDARAFLRKMRRVDGGKAARPPQPDSGKSVGT